MNIRIKQKDGLTYIQVYCDYCDKLIDKADMALYTWDRINDGEESEIYILHKGLCDKAFHKEKRWKERSPWLELRVFPVYLGNNLNLKWEKAMEDVLWFSQL